MKKLFYTLFLALFALNFVSAQQYTAYFAFNQETTITVAGDGVTYETAKTKDYPWIYIVKHNGIGAVVLDEGTFYGGVYILLANSQGNFTYINDDIAQGVSRPSSMLNFYVYTNTADAINNIQGGKDVTLNLSTFTEIETAVYYIEPFAQIDATGTGFNYAYQGSYNKLIFNNGVKIAKKGTKGGVQVKENTKYFFNPEIASSFTQIADIEYENNEVSANIINNSYTGTITNTVDNYNINYFQWVSCPYDAELTVYVGGTKAVYNDANDTGSKPAFLLMKYDNSKLEDPWVDNGSATLEKGVGYILAIDGRTSGNTAVAKYISTNNINEIENTHLRTLSENKGISSDGSDANIHLIGTGLFQTPTGCSFENARFIMFAKPKINSSGYEYIFTDELNSLISSLTPHSAFFAQTAGNLTFNMTGTITQNAPSLKRAMEQQIVVEEYNITLTGADFEEKTTILTDELGTEGYTIGEDFIYLHSTPNGDVQNKFYSFDANRTLSFNHRANTTQTIRLGGQVAQDGRYTISLDGVNTKATSVILTDNVENTFVDLINENYTFDAHKGSISDRFTVTINYAPNTTVDNDVVTNSNGIVVVNNFEGCTIENLIAGEQMMIFDAMGRLVYNAPADANSVNLTLSAGTYIVRQNNNWAKFVIK